MKIKGFEATEFYAADWDALTGIPGFSGELDDGWLTLDDEWVDDEAGLDPEAKYTLDGYYTDHQLGKTFSVVMLYRRWKRAQTHESFRVHVPVGQVDEFKALCKQRGWGV